MVETLIATTVLLIGLLGTAQLLLVSLRMNDLGRNTTDATRLARTKFDELMKLNFTTAASVQITPTSPDALAQNVTNYFDTPVAGVFTRRWRVQAGPTANTRVLTVRVVPTQTSALVTKTVELTTVIRSW